MSAAEEQGRRRSSLVDPREVGRSTPMIFLKYVAYNVIYLVCFSLMPFSYAGKVLQAMNALGDWRIRSLSGLVLFSLWLVYYLGDWGMSQLRVRLAFKTLLAVLLIFHLLTWTRVYVFLPMLVFLFSVPLIPYVLKQNRRLHWYSRLDFSRKFAKVNSTVGCLLMLAGITWMALKAPIEDGCGYSNYWNVFTRERAFMTSQCSFELHVQDVRNGTAYPIYCSFADGCGFPSSNLLGNEPGIPVYTRVANDSCTLRALPLVEFAAAQFAENVSISEARVLLEGEDQVRVEDSRGEKVAVVRVRYYGCLKAFMLWTSPLIGGAVFIWVGIVLSFATSDAVMASVSLGPTSRNAEHLDPPEATGVHEIPNHRSILLRWKFFSRILLFLLVAMWTGASIGGADMALSQVIVIFCLVGILMCIFLFAGVFGWSEIASKLSSTSVAKRLFFIGESDWFRAFMLLGLGPVFVALFALREVKTKWKKLRGLTLAENVQSNVDLVVMSVRRDRIAAIQSWKWTSILIRVLILGTLYMVLNVAVTKFTYVLMSVINAWIESLGLSIIEVTGIFFVFGIVVFLNPLTPGVPVYISGGIIVVSASEEDYGFAMAVLYATFLCVLLKLVAVAIQQKVFGEWLGRYVFVRKLIDVNSVTCKAIRVILEKPGLNWDKVVILCGGPDWPTSVTTGILRLSLPQMLFGTLPIVLLILPCVLSGALLAKVSEGSIWSTLSVFSIVLAVALQTGAMVAAMNSIAVVAKENEKELMEMPNDEEVLAYTQKKAKFQAASDVVRNWNSPEFPSSFKALLLLAVFFMDSSFYMTILIGDSCFEPFKISDSLDERLGGNAMNLIKYPMGYVCIGFFAISLVLWIVVDFQLTRATNRYMLHKVIPVEVLSSQPSK